METPCKPTSKSFNDITAAMADLRPSRHSVEPGCQDVYRVRPARNDEIFGPASADECRLFIHRAAARDALAAIGKFAPAATAAAFGSGNGALHAV